MDARFEIDTILTNLESNQFFSGGLHSAYAWSAAFAFASRKVDVYSVENPTEAQQAFFEDQLERATTLLEWAYMRTPEKLRPTAEDVVNRLVKVPDIKPTPTQIEEFRSIMGLIFDHDVLEFSPEMVKEALQAEQVERARRAGKFHSELVQDLERAFAVAAQMPATLNETFVPTLGQQRMLLAKIVDKGTKYVTRETGRWMRAFGKMKQQIHADMLLVGAAVKRANAALHTVEQELENRSSDPIEVGEGVSVH